MQSRIDEIRELGGEVLAISIDPVETNRSLVERLGLDYRVLSDPDLRVIDAFGVRHEVGVMGIDAIARPAVFILDRDGKVVWRDLTENWRVRVRPERILVELSRIP